MTDDEHRARFSQGVPIGDLPPYPSILTLNDLLDHSRLIAQTSLEYFGRQYYFNNELITMKERFAGELGTRQ